MIDLHYWTTPNGHKITIFLEETGLPYRITPVNIGKGEQFNPEFLAISPNNRIPAIVDEDPKDGGAPISVFESGAILLYLAEKTGKFIPSDIRGRVEVLQWLFWQIGGLGPMAGQNHHFGTYAPEKIPYAIDRYRNETNPALWRLEQAACRPAVPRGRLLDRRYGVLSLDRAARATGAEARGFSEPQALVRDDPPAPRYQTRPRESREDQFGAERQSGFGEDPVRPNRNEFGRGTINFSGVRRRRSASYWRPCRRAAR